MDDLVERLLSGDTASLNGIDRLRMFLSDPVTFEFCVDDAEEVNEALLEAAAELSRLSALVAEWRTMESAPKDGTPIIGAFWTIRWADSHRRGDIVRCWYQPEFGAFISSAREMTLAPGLTFEDGTSRQIHSPVIEPVTHWLPLLAPPVSQLKDTTNADK